MKLIKDITDYLCCRDWVLIILISLITITWFRGDNIISYGDFTFPLTGKSFLVKSFYCWDPIMATGLSTPRAVPSLMPLGLLAWIFEVLKVSPVVFENLMFFLWFMLCGLGAYFLGSTIGLGRLGRLTGALFYMINPFALAAVWRLSSGLLIGS